MPTPTLPIPLRATRVLSALLLAASIVVLVPAGCGAFEDDGSGSGNQPELRATRPDSAPPASGGETAEGQAGPPQQQQPAQQSAQQQAQQEGRGDIIAASPDGGTQTIPVPVDAATRQQMVQGSAPESKKKLTPQQVRSRLRSFADQYRNEIASACDQIKTTREEPLLRRRAHQYKVDGVTAVYDIAVEDNPRQAVLDMLVLVTLQWYVAESHASEQFPKDHPLIRDKTRVVKDSAWNLAAQVMSEKQRADLLSVIDRWWKDNGHRTEIWYVRITDFAGYGKGTSFEGVFEGVTNLPGKFLNAFVPIDDATESIGEATVIAERSVWLAPRLMILAQWRAETILLDALATTEITKTLDSVNEAVGVAERATKVAEDLPDQIGEQREALIRDLTENEESLKALLEEARATIESVQGVTGDTNEIVNGGQELLRVADSTLKTADQVVKSVESMLATAKAGGDDKADEEPGKPFDINEYTEAIRSAESTLNELNTVLTNLETATQPDELTKRVEPVLNLSEEFVDDTLTRVERLVIVAAIAFAAAGIAIVAFAKLVPSRRRERDSA